jgi:hypothetical protein
MDLPLPLDRLELFNLVEDPDRWERLIAEENRRAKFDPTAKAILESMYWEEDRDQAFTRFRDSLDFSCLRKLLNLFGVRHDHGLCEIGGGNGCLAWALAQADFRNVTLLEPNPHFITGTGYLRTRRDASHLAIENDLRSWYRSPVKYDVVLTRNCLHHFPNLAWSAACIRQKLVPRGRWIVIREPFAETARELYRFLHGHPYSQAYGVFEFALPVAHYVESLNLAGMRLTAAVPAGYANDCLSQYETSPGGTWNRFWTAMIDRVLGRWPGITAAAWRVERLLHQALNLPLRWFGRPQVMLFERVELGHVQAGDIWYRPDRAGHAIAGESLPPSPAKTAA